MKPPKEMRLQRRHGLHLAAAGLAALCWPAWAQRPDTISKLGIFSLLGDSVRIVALEPREALFKDLGMDKLAFDAVGRAVLASQAGAELQRYSAPAEVDVAEQVDIGTAAGRRAELPAWVAKTARDKALSHLVLVTSSTGAMEFRTGLSQVVGNERVTGVGFMVSATGRLKDASTGVVSSGYLAPFVQLRLTLIDLNGPRVVHSSTLSEGFVVGSTVAEGSEPWQFLSRQDKARALRDLMQRVIGRGMKEVLAAL